MYPEMTLFEWYFIALINTAAFTSPKATADNGAFWAWHHSRHHRLWISHPIGPNGSPREVA